MKVALDFGRRPYKPIMFDSNHVSDDNMGTTKPNLYHTGPRNRHNLKLTSVAEHGRIKGYIDADSG